MTEQASTGCVVTFVDGPCGNAPTSGLPICGSCLRTLLDEEDPRRRRTLASNQGLAAGVIQQLAEDPDDQVRAQVAARADLDAATVNRLADPDRESTPIVWHSMAATAGGAAHAWELMGSDDPTTLAILAANPAVDPDILEQLTHHPDPNVSWTASATLAGQPAGDVIAQRLGEARSYDGLPLGVPATPSSRPDSTDAATQSDGPFAAIPPTRPIGEAPDSVAVPVAPPTASSGGTGALPPRPSPGASRVDGRRRGLALLVGAVALVMVAAVVLVVAFTGDGSDRVTTAAGPDPTPAVTAPDTTSPRTTAAAPTTDMTTTPPATTVTPSTQPPPPPTRAPVVTPAPVGVVDQDFTIASDAGRFCGSVTVTVNYSPSPGYVVVTDDAGARVGGWGGVSGQTKVLQLPNPTSALHVNVASLGNAISVSGSATGSSC